MQLAPTAPPGDPFDHTGAPLPGGLEVHGVRLRKDGRAFFVSGFNHWAASTLARDGDVAGWDQVRRDLDLLQTLGVNTIRTLAATEGPDNEPWRIVPSIQPSPGRYDLAGVAGVLRVAGELQQRRMHGIFALNNFWHWSGGMAQYVAWSGDGPIPYPPPHQSGDWTNYQRFAARFYDKEPAREAFRAYVRFLVPQLRSNPAVVWELANEPRGRTNVVGLRAWIDETARLVKSLAPRQLVTTGSEGQTSAPEEAGLDVIEDHRSPAIDFITFHLWAQNWGWLRPECLAEDFSGAVDRAIAYVRDHARLAAIVGKPILLEEFGFPRDGASFRPSASTNFRDRYFDRLYAEVHALLSSTPMAGIMPWSWAGESRPSRPGEYWRPGDPFTGDPPHEEQGWYGVYAQDTTVEVVRRWSPRIVLGS